MRKNSYKGWKTPGDILKQYGLSEEILVLTPVVIDDILYKDRFFRKREKRIDFQDNNNYINLYNQVYHHVSEHPENSCANNNRIITSLKSVKI
jgi:hypothetical protein